MRELAGDMLRVYKLICYGALAPELVSDLWLKRLLKDAGNNTAFKARVWMTIVHRLTNVGDADDVNLAVCYPRAAVLLKSMENSVVGAYIALADDDRVQLVARTINFGIHASALAFELLDGDIAEKLFCCMSSDEYSVILNRYLLKLCLGGTPRIFDECLVKIKDDSFEDFKHRAYVYSKAMLEGEGALKEVEKTFGFKKSAIKKYFPVNVCCQDIISKKIEPNDNGDIWQ